MAAAVAWLNRVENFVFLVGFGLVCGVVVTCLFVVVGLTSAWCTGVNAACRCKWGQSECFDYCFD